jgi:hypothetical protein
LGALIKQKVTASGANLETGLAKVRKTGQSGFSRRRKATLLLFLLLMSSVLSALHAHAQGGPPFITDDPGTPGNRHWEINIGWIAQHNPGKGSYQIPDLDINYGLGDRIQLKYEVPLAATTDQNDTTLAGLGQSFPGIKWRFYEHHTAGEAKSDENMNFSLGTYPQALINNPTNSVSRGIVEPGPQYYLPIEFSAKVGPIAFNGEVGHWFGNRHVPDRWGRGLIVGHEFNDRFELYGELYDLQDRTTIGDQSKQRVFTGDIGGRRTLDKTGHLRLLFLGGRALQAVSTYNSEPDWIGYLGIQILLGPQKVEVLGQNP